MNSEVPETNNSNIAREEMGKEHLVIYACLLFFVFLLLVNFEDFRGAALQKFILTSQKGVLVVTQQGTPFSNETGVFDPAQNAAMAPFLFLPININACDQTLLMSIRGIGPSLASKIIQYRAENGYFEKSADLLNVSGIGPARLQSIRPFLSFPADND